MTSLLDQAWAGSRAFVGWLFLLGISVGIGITSAAWMIHGGYRNDAQGTGPTDGEMTLGWGGLILGSVLFVVSVLAVVCPRATPRTMFGMNPETARRTCWGVFLVLILANFGGQAFDISGSAQKIVGIAAMAQAVVLTWIECVHKQETSAVKERSGI